MRLVVDANIFVAELVRKHGRDLMANPALHLYVAQQAWEEAEYELRKRVRVMVDQGSIGQAVGEGVSHTDTDVYEVFAGSCGDLSVDHHRVKGGSKDEVLMNLDPSESKRWRLKASVGYRATHSLLLPDLMQLRR